MTSAISIPGAMALRDYQQEAITAITAAWLRGVRRQLIALPTSAGKTIVFAHLASYHRGRTLILAHRDELIQQAAERARAMASVKYAIARQAYEGRKAGKHQAALDEVQAWLEVQRAGAAHEARERGRRLRAHLG
jgi:superfamily II DNA or RNA helicase